MNEKKKEPLFHIVKRDAIPWYQSLGIRAAAIVLALILCAIGKMLTEGRHEAKPLFDREGWKRVGIMFAIMIGYLAAMWYVGYLISTLVFTPMLVVAMREDRKLRPVTLAIFSVVTTTVLYFVFQNIIMVTLPTGVLFR